ncbi:MAG: hypothetical protein H7A46_12045 [Verrucomicrobiales bacterium]|nr:hypothetical protein [Verrucomicrobiales bacterium]
MKTHLPDPQTRRIRFAPPAGLLLGSIVMASIHAQLPDLNIGVDSVCLTWAPTGEECIVVCAESPDGPWTPVPVPIREVDGQHHAVVRCSDQQKYFRLAKGLCFTEGFEATDLEGWTVLHWDPATEGIIIPEVSCGALRIHGPNAGFDSPLIALYRTDRALADFGLSLDILDWAHEDGAGANLAMIARLDPAFDPSSRVDPQAYFGCLVMSDNQDRRKSNLGFYTKYPDDWDYSPFERTDAAKDYRIEFTGVGNKLTLRLFELGSGRLVHEFQEHYNKRDSGLVGFYVVDHDPTVDFRVDNFIAVGTTSE